MCVHENEQQSGCQLMHLGGSPFVMCDVTADLANQEVTNKVERCKQGEQMAGTSKDAIEGALRHLGATANEMHRYKEHKSKGRKLAQQPQCSFLS